MSKGPFFPAPSKGSDRDHDSAKDGRNIAPPGSKKRAATICVSDDRKRADPTLSVLLPCSVTITHTLLYSNVYIHADTVNPLQHNMFLSLSYHPLVCIVRALR